MAGVRRGAARRRHPVQFPARTAGVGNSDRADHRKSVRDRYIDTERRLSRAVVYLLRVGAVADRLAVSAHPVPSPGAAAPAERTFGTAGVTPSSPRNGFAV